MLVLSRKAGERVLIGEEIKVEIVRIGPNTVRIGITAPKEMNIRREELIDVGDSADVGPVPGDGGVDSAALGVGAETDQGDG